MSQNVKAKLTNIWSSEQSESIKRGLAITAIMVYDELGLKEANNALNAWLGV